MELKPSVILLRVAASATNALELFQCPSVLHHARLAECALERLEARRRERCDTLHLLIPTQTGSTRRALLDLKRAVHNNRRLEAPLNSSPLAEAFAPLDNFTQDLSTWEGELKSYHEALEHGGEALRADWARLKENLARAWSDDLLQRGVLYAQPELYRKLHKVIQPARPPKKRDQRWELPLLAYAYRAATKTSPFSTLTLTAVGRPAEAVDLFQVPEPTDLSSLLVVSPDLVGALARRWLANPKVAARAPLRSPDLTELNCDRIVYLHVYAPGRGKPAVEAIRTLSDAPIAEFALRLLRETPGPHCLLSFQKLLEGALGCDKEVLSGLMQQLHEFGLLRPTLEYDACRPDALEGLVKATAALGGIEVEPGLALAATLVERLRSLVGRPAQEQEAGLATTLADMNNLLGEEAEVRPGRAVFDRCGFSRVIDIPAATIDWVVPTLRQILGMLPLFNVEHGADRLVQEFFHERCAGGIVLPILAAFADFREFLQARFGVEGRDPFTRAAKESEAASGATTSRQALIAELRDLFSCAPGEALSLPADFLARWAELARPYEPRRTRLSASFLGQLIATGDTWQPRFVLNSVVSGYGTLAAAWACADAERPAGACLRSHLVEELQALDPGGDVVEIAAALNFGGQVRERLTPFFLCYPGDTSIPDPLHRIDWRELGLALDAQLGRVVLVRRPGLRRVLPLHLGTLSSFYFPPFYRFLVSLGPAFTPAFAVIDFIEEELSEADRSAPRRYGRITAEPIVLSRETWCVPAQTLPRFGDGTLSFSDFLALRRWARDLDLPRRIFVTGAQTADLFREGLDFRSLRRARKPFFVDFDDFASCALMCRFTRRVGPTVRLSEMLPLPEQNPFRDDHHGCRGRVVECVLEVQGDALQ